MAACCLCSYVRVWPECGEGGTSTAPDIDAAQEYGNYAVMRQWYVFDSIESERVIRWASCDTSRIEAMRKRTMRIGYVLNLYIMRTQHFPVLLKVQ